MFPTTIWTRILQAGEQDGAALEAFARAYRAPILDYVRARGFRGADADDLCQEVFVRLLAGNVLAKADRERGRFRGLLRTVTLRVVQDRLRRRREPASEAVDEAREPSVSTEFDDAWVVHLVERALARLAEQGSPYHAVLRDHLAGAPQDRQRLWLARKKLAELLRDEVARTCAAPADLEAEMAYLAPFLESRQKG